MLFTAANEWLLTELPLFAGEAKQMQKRAFSKQSPWEIDKMELSFRHHKIKPVCTFMKMFR